MDIRIGIFNSPREIGFETTQPANEVEETVAAALAGQSRYLLKLSDDKGQGVHRSDGRTRFTSNWARKMRRVGFVA